jgi:hypothetical protein
MGKRHIFRAIDEGLRQRHLGRVHAQHNFVGECLEGLRIELAVCALRGLKICVVDVGFAPVCQAA